MRNLIDSLFHLLGTVTLFTNTLELTMASMRSQNLGLKVTINV